MFISKKYKEEVSVAVHTSTAEGVRSTLVRELRSHMLGGGLVAMSDSWDPIDCSLPGSTDHGVSQVRILQWVAISFSMPRGTAKEINSFYNNKRDDIMEKWVKN